jgi:hypothetical protein
MSCADRYDLFITDGEGAGHGLICDWDRGGSGLKIDAPSSLESTAVSTKGDYGVRDAKDAFRIVQSDWSEGAGQLSYDRDQDSESAFWASKSIDVSTIGTMRLGPALTITDNTDRLAYSLAALKSSGTPLVFASQHGTPYLEYSLDGVDWTGVTVGTLANDVVGLCTDGAWVYVIADTSGSNNPVQFGKPGTAFASLSSSGSNSGFNAIAFASGVLYGAKDGGGNDMFGGTTSSQLGCFNSTSPDPVWTALSPEAGRNINAVGVSFGLVAVGSYVYWGITNGMVTKVYKAKSGGGTVDDELTEVCTFPHGFVGASLYSYLNTVYVGGHFDGATANTGLGAIYAVINDTPALLTEVGSDRTLDNRVLSMCAYERNLFFISGTQLWRWDLRYGGYSHWAGPLNSVPITIYENLTWVGTWDMAAAPGTGAEPDTDIDYLNLATAVYDGAMTATIASALDEDSRVRVLALPNSPAGATNHIDDTVGTTVELDLPTNALSRWGTGVRGGAIHFGVNGSAKSAWVRLALDPTDRYAYVHVDLYSGNGRTTNDTLIASSNGWQASTTDTTEMTVRLTLKNGTATVYLCSATLGTTKLLCSGKVSVTPASGYAKMPFLKFVRSYKQGTHPQWYSGPQYAIVNRFRWGDVGAYAPDSPVEVSGASLACTRDAVYVACTGYGDGVTTPDGYPIQTADQDPPSLTYSSSTGNMPTVDKYFSAFHVQLENTMPDSCSLVLSGTVDGKTFQGAQNSDLSTETQIVFDIGIQGRSIQPVLSFVSTDSGYTPIVTDTAVLFSPMPKTAKVMSYYIRCWENVESRVPRQKWDEKATVVADWLEEIANTIVTVERPGRDAYRGKVETLEYVEAPPSQKANGREGLYQLAIRKVT